MEIKFAERLKELRQEKGLSQLALSKQIGVKHSTIIRWESGTMIPTITYVAKLALFFNVSTDYLIGLKDYE